MSVAKVIEFSSSSTKGVEDAVQSGLPGNWQGAGLSGALPVSEKVLSGSGETLVPLAREASARLSGRS